MSEQSESTDIESELFEERDMVPEEVSNAYFLLDLNIPSPKRDVPVVRANNQNEASTSSPKLHKFGFLELLEKIHGRDLRTNNPWFNPAASKVHWKERSRKRVRFSTTEINSKRAELPHCRKKGDPVIKPGQLHAPGCRNASQETVEVLGDHVWQNRVFILESYMRNALHSYSRSRENSDSEGEGEGYYKARAESLEELGVFDSVELAKQRLKLFSGRDDLQETEQATSSDRSHPLPLLHPDTANLNLELGSPISDEEGPHTASTLKHMSDQAYTDSPDNVFVWPHHSAESNCSSNPESKPPDQPDSTPSTQPVSNTEEDISTEQGLNDAFKSTENTFQFQMYEPPKFNKLLSHSDYGSEEPDEDDIDLAKLLDELPAIAPTNSLSVLPAIAPTKRSSETAIKQNEERVTLPNQTTQPPPPTRDIKVTVEPPTPSPASTTRTSFMRPDEVARLRGTVKIAERSAIGSMMSGGSSSNAVPRRDESEIHQLTEFMFDTPSPDD